jgi:hypothetical protein
VIQVLDYLPTKCKALSLKCSTAQKKRKGDREGGRKEERREWRGGEGKEEEEKGERGGEERGGEEWRGREGRRGEGTNAQTVSSLQKFLDFGLPVIQNETCIFGCD